MKPLDIMTGPWMITPEKLAELKAAFSAHMKDGKIKTKDLESRAPGTVEDFQGKWQYDILKSAAIIPIKGIISKDPTVFSFFFSGTSTKKVARLIEDALNNRDITAIVLDIDSPGGTVDGTQELANLIFSKRHRKPIVAWTDGMVASAAYYIASAADKIFISGDMPPIGSIGVVTSHIDYSKMDERHGIKETEIYAGKYKRIASYVEPLSQEGREYIQDRVDYIYSIFVNDVAKYRGVTVDTVLKNMADGQMFIGRQALDAGLVDGVSTFDQLLDTELPPMRVQCRQSAHQWLTNLNKELGKNPNS